ncbi:MAG: GMC family oxidoreductase, partial [Saprospiraceae bacterium]|nr:GMC family oxidoreductase [Saprospiraceae bacterium]
GQPGEKVSDPYFNGKGPDRTGCIHCGACMTGCRHNAKNTLDKNYLYLAQDLGAEILAEHEVIDVRPLDNDRGESGYMVQFKKSTGNGKLKKIETRNIVFAGGVLGTVPLLLKLKQKGSLPDISDMLGGNVRTNNESLMVVTSTDKDHPDYTSGVSIGSILDIDKNSHLEPVRYGKGSGFFRMMTMPSAHHKWALLRIAGVFWKMIKQPFRFVKTLFANRYSSRSVILLFMQTLDSTLRLKTGKLRSLVTEAESGPLPSGHIPEASKLARKVSAKLNGIPYSNFYDVIRGTPTTAHILGGAVMGKDPTKGVIDKNNNVFGYKNMMVCDGSMISANPGVNPSLSITAISELAMSRIPAKDMESS